MKKRSKQRLARYQQTTANQADRLAAAQEQITSLKAELAVCRTAAEKLERALEQSRASRVKIRLVPARRKAGSTVVRVIVPDSHGCFIDEAAAAALLADIAAIQPDSIIMLGDHLDCGGFLAEHQTWGYVAEMAYTFEDDVNATNQFLDGIQAAAPGSRIEYLEGNHERRIQKQLVTQTLRGGKRDASFLEALFSVSVVLHLEKRGIAFFKQGVFYDDCKVPATIERDNCYFTHGQFTGEHAAAAHLRKYAANVWFGHTHRSESKIKRTVSSGPIGAWNAGCLCRIQPYWMHQNLTDWSHGYGLQIAEAGVGHLNMQIPILDGVSLLPLLLGRESRTVSKTG